MKFKKGDSVVIISGKDKGKTGIVREINKIKKTLIVEGINIRTHHIKPTQQNTEGGILQKEGPINSSKVMLNIGGKKIQVSKIIYKTELIKGKKKKIRYSKKNGEAL